MRTRKTRKDTREYGRSGKNIERHGMINETTEDWKGTIIPDMLIEDTERHLRIRTGEGYNFAEARQMKINL